MQAILKISVTKVLLFGMIALQGFSQEGPKPGDIYREYAIDLRSGDNWRVTDPHASHPGAAEFLPNPVLTLEISDLENAIRAEILMDIWGGHPGTSGKKFRLNDKPWINIPEVPTLTIRSQCYMKQYNTIVEIPLEYLIEGENTFEGSAGRQVCGNFNWGQWGWYLMLVRVYYNDVGDHSTGRISWPGSGDTITEDPLIRVDCPDSAAISRIQLLGNYFGYDENGDGIFKDWHRAYHDVGISGHIGTLHKPPFQHTWNTRNVPDQETGTISLVARIRDTSGIWFVTEPVSDLSLDRGDSLSVRMYWSGNIPESFWVRAGRTMECEIHIPDPDQATEAVLYHRTWNGGDGEAAGGTIRKPLRINKHSYKCYGNNHFFALSGVLLATGDLLEGQNTIAYTSNTDHHGIEILWPGPALVVRYVKGGATLSSPVFSPPDGHSFQGVLHPVISYESDGRKIYYTTDGSDPNPSDHRYSRQILQVDREITLKARAFKPDHKESEVATAHYVPEASGLAPDHRQANLEAYPNPAGDYLYLKLPPGAEYGRYTIMDEKGRILVSGSPTGHMISTQGLGAGSYFLTLEMKQQSYSTWFLVLR